MLQVHSKAMLWLRLSLCVGERGRSSPEVWAQVYLPAGAQGTGIAVASMAQTDGGWETTSDLSGPSSLCSYNEISEFG